MHYLTIAEAAEALHLSVPTIKRYIYEGKLRSTKLPGGQHRIPQSEIDRILSPDAASGAHVEETAPPSLAERVAVLERWVTDLEMEVERLTAALEVVSRYCALHIGEAPPADRLRPLPPPSAGLRPAADGANFARSGAARHWPVATGMSVKVKIGWHH